MGTAARASYNSGMKRIIPERPEGLDDLVRRGVQIDDVVIQDELTHDVITRGSEGTWVVYETT
jgi:hypothetical protein